MFIHCITRVRNFAEFHSEFFKFSAECTNQFVVVNIAASTVSCIFLNNLNTTNQSCGIMYWLCDEGGVRNVQNYDLSNNAKLMLTTSGYYCYVITATNGWHTIRIEGSFGKEYTYRFCHH